MKHLGWTDVELVKKLYYKALDLCQTVDDCNEIFVLLEDIGFATVKLADVTCKKIESLEESPNGGAVVSKTTG